MRKFLMLVCAVTLSGCAWLGFGDDSTTTATAEPQAEQEVQVEEATPAPATAKTTKATTRKGAKTEAQIKAELDVMGKKLAAQSARTLLPNKSNPNYKQVGKEWVASYIDVNPNSVTTSMTPGKNGVYVGSIRYTELFMECRGPSKQAALKGNCTQVKTRNMNELIRYDGKEWQD